MPESSRGDRGRGSRWEQTTGYWRGPLVTGGDCDLRREGQGRLPPWSVLPPQSRSCGRGHGDYPKGPGAAAASAALGREDPKVRNVGSRRHPGARRPGRRWAVGRELCQEWGASVDFLDLFTEGGRCTGL